MRSRHESRNGRARGRVAGVMHRLLLDRHPLRPGISSHMRPNPQGRRVPGRRSNTTPVCGYTKDMRRIRSANLARTGHLDIASR